ncbi:MAG: hypothetical protein IT426_18675 [Pirellulales bacterium]|nr:hypothetical protein [Pirellulales bacterium]
MRKRLILGKIIAMAALLVAAFSSRAWPQPLLPGFEKSAWFGEQVIRLRPENGVRGLIVAPVALKAPRRLLIVYATPNGNTLEQTLGCAAEKGRDWHFDIQHVAAQSRCFRELDAAQDVILAVVQSPQLSWPSFRQARPNADKEIRQLVDALVAQCQAEKAILACHSGGGSFVLGYLNAVDAIPPAIERIILLDANYSYSDDKRHGDKLLAWLAGDPPRRLVVVAYDDREIAANGKKIIGPDGGTFRASQRMLTRFRRDLELTDADEKPFTHTRDKSGKIQFFIHRNPENKILHTALVGEMNGLLLGLTLGTEQEKKWGSFGGPRAYAKWIQPEPFAEQTTPRPDEKVVRLKLPERSAEAPTGSKFREEIAALSLDRREAAAVREIAQGNIPDFLRRMKSISLSAAEKTGVRHTGQCYVMPDYLAVGTDADFFRIPLTLRTAMKIADMLGCTLPTVKIADAVFAAADSKLDPRPMTKDRETVATFFQHHQLIEGQLRGKSRGMLVAGIKKDVVLTNRLKEKPHKVAIYGWHYPDGRPIQPLYVGHWDAYVDYSHGIRLIAEEMIIDGRTMRVSDVLKDERLCGLLSDEGPIDVPEVRKAAGWESDKPGPIAPK